MGAEGEGAVEEATGFEVCIVLPKLSRAAATGPTEDCVARLVRELEGAGLLVERVRGVPAEFIKVCDPGPQLLFFSFLFNSVCGYAFGLSGGGGDAEEREPPSIGLARKLCNACCLLFFQFCSDACGPAV